MKVQNKMSYKNILVFFISSFVTFSIYGFQITDNEMEKNNAVYYKLQLFSSPQNAYILSDSEFEFSFPDLNTLSHLRFYYGKANDYQFYLGIGLILVDFGFSKIITEIENKFPVKSQTILGYSVFNQFYGEQKVIVGLSEYQNRESQILFNVSISSGYKSSSNADEEQKAIYFSEDSGFSFVYKRSVFSVNAGISQVALDGNFPPKNGYQFGFQMSYLIE